MLYIYDQLIGNNDFLTKNDSTIYYNINGTVSEIR